MAIPKGLKYSREHEWVRIEGDHAYVGITDHAQEQLGEIVYLELPKKGERIDKEEAFGVVESTKAVSDIYAPITGAIVETNDDLVGDPARLNRDPYEDGWMVKVKIEDQADLKELMTSAEYAEFLKEGE